MASRRGEAVPLYMTPRNPNRETVGGRKAAISAQMGQPFMPWQRELADVWGEIDPATGGPWYREMLLLGLRQIGKTTFARADLTDTGLYYPRSLIRYTAQNRNMALSRLEHDFYTPLRDSRLKLFLDPRVGTARKGRLGYHGKTGNEHIAFVNGSRWEIDSVKESSGHGPALTKGCIDEAFAHPDARVEQAMTPAMSTISHAQLLVASAAGNSASIYLARKREAAVERFERAVERDGPMGPTRGRTLFVEFAASKDADREDPTVWWATHPALGYTITEGTIAAALESMEDEEFDRAYLGWWPRKKGPPPVMPLADMADCEVEADNSWDGEPTWAVDVSPDRDFAAVGFGAAGAEPGRNYAEVVRHEPGTSWVVDYLELLRMQFGGNVVALDGTGAAGALVPDLESAGFTVRRLSGREKVDACGALYDDVLSHRFAHIGDEILAPTLTAAVKRTVSDGGFMWVRGRSLQDITPLYVVTIGRFAHVERAADDYDPSDSVY